jgi:hypothetical protein
MGLLECVTALAGAKKGLYASGAGMGEGTASAAGRRARRARSFIVTYRLFGGIRSKEEGVGRLAILILKRACGKNVSRSTTIRVLMSV